MRAALYPRVSTMGQAEDGYSVGEQIERLTKFCEAKGWTVFKIYTDAGYSGANTERPALQEMMKAVEDGCVVIDGGYGVDQTIACDTVIEAMGGTGLAYKFVREARRTLFR